LFLKNAYILLLVNVKVFVFHYDAADTYLLLMGFVPVNRTGLISASQRRAYVIDTASLHDIIAKLCVEYFKERAFPCSFKWWKKSAQYDVSHQTCSWLVTLILVH
jgi:hypothetical protein